MRRKQYRKQSPVLPVLICLVTVVGISFGAAWVWQSAQDAALEASSAKNEIQPSAALAEETPEPSATVKTAPPPSSSESEEASPADESSSAPVEEPSTPQEPVPDHTARPEFPYALSQSEMVPTSYFDDAIFFGDSISTGILPYNVMPNTDVIAFTGISTVNAVSKECIDTESGRKTMLDAAKELGEKSKVYILLGGNGLGYDKQTFIKGYKEFVGAVKLQYPDARIYIQTMPPVTDYATDTYPSVSNEIIHEFNLAIQDMARSEGVLLVDIASALMDENGKLPEEASPVDGMHFTPEYYTKWFHYLRTHTGQ